MTRKQLSLPVALMVIVAGATLMYYVLHSHGWSLNGTVSLSDTFRQMSLVARALTVAGLVATAWGVGAALNRLLQNQNPN